jgi:hypothetical protein
MVSLSVLGNTLIRPPIKQADMFEVFFQDVLFFLAGINIFPTGCQRRDLRGRGWRESRRIQGRNLGGRRGF